MKERKIINRHISFFSYMCERKKWSLWLQLLIHRLVAFLFLFISYKQIKFFPHEENEESFANKQSFTELDGKLF